MTKCISEMTCNSIKQWNVGTVITMQKLPDVHFFFLLKRLNHNIFGGDCHVYRCDYMIWSCRVHLNLHTTTNTTLTLHTNITDRQDLSPLRHVTDRSVRHVTHTISLILTQKGCSWSVTVVQAATWLWGWRLNLLRVRGHRFVSTSPT